MLPGECARIESQIAEAESVIERETTTFMRRHKDEFPEEETHGEREQDPKEKDLGEPQRETESVPAAAASAPPSDSHATNIVPPPPVPASSSDRSGPVQVVVIGTGTEREAMDENGEVVMVGDEDTVIY
jgi:hypothetical protein